MKNRPMTQLEILDHIESSGISCGKISCSGSKLGDNLNTGTSCPFYGDGCGCGLGLAETRPDKVVIQEMREALEKMEDKS